MQNSAGSFSSVWSSRSDGTRLGRSADSASRWTPRRSSVGAPSKTPPIWWRMGSSRVAVLQVRAAQAGVRRGDRAGFVAWASAAGDARYVAEASVKGGAAIDWDDPGAPKRFLGELGTDPDHRLEGGRRARGGVPPGSPQEAAVPAGR